MEPSVTFIVPCYNLAHFLPECIQSILEQSFSSFEILIMDDCSPDNTQEVARSFKDDRIRYERNATNLGNIRNYNRGFRLARGKFVWLLSADDKLRRPHTLERFVATAEGCQRIGLVFCPAVAYRDGTETGILRSGYYGRQDRHFPVPKFGMEAGKCCPVAAPSGMVRRDCYEQMDYMPEDLPRAADWFTWGFIGLRYHVAYLGEPLVNYRLHSASMDANLKRNQQEFARDQDFAVRWRLFRDAQQVGLPEVEAVHFRHLTAEYGKRLALNELGYEKVGLDWEALEESLLRHSARQDEAAAIRRRAMRMIPNWLYHYGHRRLAAQHYLRLVPTRPLDPRLYVKLLLSLITLNRKAENPVQSCPQLPLD